MELTHILNLRTNPFSAQFVFYKKNFKISSNLGSKNNFGSAFFESKLLEILKKIKKNYKKRIVPKMDLFLSLKYGAIPYNGLGFTAI